MKTETKYFILDKPEKSSLKGIVKKGLKFLKAVTCMAKSMFIQCKTQDRKYNVSICAIFKNEASYLKEWLEFNHLVGTDHFYMYNNNSNDSFRIVLQPYIDIGWVDLIEWPYDQKQMECYMDCIERHSSETKWLGFIDIDEFIVPKSTNNIYEFLKPFETKAGSVCIYWRLYGSSGRLHRDTHRLVSEDMVVCWPKYCDIGKCFYNTAFEFNPKSQHAKGLHHWFWANWRGKDIPPVNIFDRICFAGHNRVPNSDFPIQINHYFTKSYEEYAVKKSKGDVYFKSNPHDEAYFYEHEMKCTSIDYSAYKYIIKLKLEMAKQRGS